MLLIRNRGYFNGVVVITPTWVFIGGLFIVDVLDGGSLESKEAAFLSPEAKAKQ